MTDEEGMTQSDSSISPEQSKVIEETIEDLRSCFNEGSYYWYERESNESQINFGELSDLDPRLWRPRIEKILLNRIKKQLEDSPSYNHEFKDSTHWPVLNQMLVLARLREISQVKIVKKGGRGVGLRYDISELMATFFGKKILHGLDMKRRRVATKEELESIRAACLRIKLDLPEIIEPTTTEQFFALSTETDA